MVAALLGWTVVVVATKVLRKVEAPSAHSGARLVHAVGGGSSGDGGAHGFGGTDACWAQTCQDSARQVASPETRRIAYAVCKTLSGTSTTPRSPVPMRDQSSVVISVLYVILYSVHHRLTLNELSTRVAPGPLLPVTAVAVAMGPVTLAMPLKCLRGDSIMSASTGHHLHGVPGGPQPIRNNPWNQLIARHIMNRKFFRSS